MADPRKRNRMVFDTDEVVKRAIRMRAGLDGVKPGDVINHAVQAYLTKEIALAKDRLQERTEEGAEGQKKSRKRKDDRTQ